MQNGKFVLNISNLQNTPCNVSKRYIDFMFGLFCLVFQSERRLKG